MKKKFLAVLAVSLVSFTWACTKLPDKLLSPSIRIEPTVQDGKNIFVMKFTAGIFNENFNLALKDCKGKVTLHEKKKPENAVFTLPFEVPLILPYDTGIVEIEKKLEERDMAPLLGLVGTTAEKLAADKGMESVFIDESSLTLGITSYNKKHIMDLLKEKMNEKN